MIKLTRASRPPFLTDEKVAELTAEFVATGRSVWNNEHIKGPLLASSNGKCAYCECPLLIDSNYMEVEHYESKRSNASKVVDWENLLPACKRCNGAKSDHDTNAEPIVNPYVDDPRDHLVWRLYRLRGKTTKGSHTIDVTALNNQTRLVLGRFHVGEKIAQVVETAVERLRLWRLDPSTRNKNRLISTVEGLLAECEPRTAYSASAATALLTEPDFTQLVEDMRAASIWNGSLESQLKGASMIAFETI